MSLSRRSLINAVGRAGGVAAAYRTMAAMGLLPVPAAYAGPPDLPIGSGRGTKVVILGAGIAGMGAAWELGRAGYDCTVLEARKRAGGRNWSLRAGDEVLETDSVQHVRWNIGEHLYFNPGPARLPYNHQGILSYCRDLGVPVEVMCNDNRGAVMQDDAAFSGAPQLNRAVVNDAHGYLAELAGKAVDHGLLDAPLTAEDGERLRGFLRSMGALDKDLVYRGSSRAGWAVEPGAAMGQHRQPLDFRQLLLSDFWQGKIFFGEFSTQAATMLQPVGGMGRIGQTFARKLGPVITTGAEVTHLRREGDGARVEWKDVTSGRAQSVLADWVICTLPFTVLRSLDADFAAPTRAGIAALDYIPAGKIAFQADRRFWELDESIYGGISWTSRDITQIWYPTAGIDKPKGILVGAYIWDDETGRAFAAKPIAKRLSDGLADGEHVHAGYGRFLSQGVAVSWLKVPYSLGAWSEWTRETRERHYALLQKGDGPVLFAGEHMSWITGWQEGAVRSAQFAVGQIAERVRAKKT